EEAVKAYHGVLQHLKIRPHRSLADDMVLQTGVMNYAGNGRVISPPLTPNPSPPITGERGVRNPTPHPPPPKQGRGEQEAGNVSEAKACMCACPCNGAQKQSETPAKASGNGTVDFTKMTPAEKVAYHKARWDRILG